MTVRVWALVCVYGRLSTKGVINLVCANTGRDRGNCSVVDN